MQTCATLKGLCALRCIAHRIMQDSKFSMLSKRSTSAVTTQLRIAPKQFGKLRIAAKIISLVALVVFDYISLQGCLDSPGTTRGNVRLSNVRNIEQITPVNSGNIMRSSTIRKDEETPYLNPRIAFVTHTFLEGGQFENDHIGRFQRTIFAATKTWLQGHLYFVVMTLRSLRHYESLCQQHAAECERIVPILVDCPEGYWGDSPCCKMQEGLLFMFDQYPEYDWYYYGDDDQYMRVEYLEEFLSPFDVEDQAMTVTSESFKLTRQTRDRDGADDDDCSSVGNPRLRLGGQPVIYSHAGLLEVKKGLQMNGLRRQCMAARFNHMVGQRVFNWMHQLPEVQFMVSQSTPSVLSEQHNTLIGLRCATYHIDRSNGGRITSSPLERIHAFFQNRTYPEAPYEYRWTSDDTAFRETVTYKEYGKVAEWKTWHTMRVGDCEGP